jgi:hypothetical protein
MTRPTANDASSAVRARLRAEARFRYRTKFRAHPRYPVYRWRVSASEPRWHRDDASPYRRMPAPMQLILSHSLGALKHCVADWIDATARQY